MASVHTQCDHGLSDYYHHIGCLTHGPGIADADGNSYEITP